MTHDAERWSPNDELLDRFLAERIAPDERVAVETWLGRTPAGWRAVHALRQLRFGVESDVGQAELWQRIERRCRGIIETGSLGRGVSPREKSESPALKRIGVLGTQPLRGKVWYTLTASIMGAVLIIAGWKLSSAWMAGHHVTGELPYTTYTTASGQQATINLPDGNTVALNVASRLEIPDDYSSGHHVVRLPVGEALFTILHHQGTPFTVVTNAATTQVLGTKFVVRHYLTDTVSTVAVEEGKVAVGSTVVTERHLIQIGHDGMTHSQVADPSLFAFTTGVLTLGVTTLSGAIPELNRWYNADIRLGVPSLGLRQVTGAFTAGSLSDLTETLKLTFNVRVMRNGRVLTLYPETK